MNGKGSKRRPEDQERMERNWAKIQWRRDKREKEKRDWVAQVVEDMNPDKRSPHF